MSEPPLKEVLAAFDEAALIGLASKGLLRRARRDVEQNLADIVEQNDAAAVIQADGEEVQLDTKGPAAARCSCPAAGMCRHILAAVLVVQAGGEDASDPVPQDAPSPSEDADTPVEQPDAPVDAPDPVAEICGLTETALAKWAGKAAMRAAREMLAEEEAPGVSREGRAVVVRFADDVPEIRYLSGLGLDGMVSKVSKTKRKALHAAAVLAVRRGEGIETVPDALPDAQPAAGPVKPDAAFLNAVERCLADCVRTGFNKAPLVLEERLFALSVATRADDLPRLSRLLRAISAMVRSKRAREFTLDTHAYFSRVADAFMLVRALQSDENTSDMIKLGALAGLVRQDYAATQTLDLFGAGAQVWQTGSGARGVTGYFYSADQNRWFSASLARSSGQDPSFKPMDAYRSEALWSAGSLESLSRNRVVLTDPAASADGRLSMAKTVKCVTTPWQATREAVAQWPACIHSWGELQSDLLRLFRPSLSEGQVAPCPVLLAPSQPCAGLFRRSGPANRLAGMRRGRRMDRPDPAARHLERSHQRSSGGTGKDPDHVGSQCPCDIRARPFRPPAVRGLERRRREVRVQSRPRCRRHEPRQASHRRRQAARLFPQSRLGREFRAGEVPPDRAGQRHFAHTA